MATPIVMPKQGNTVEECLLVAWRKTKGQTVAAGETLADIETDKASFELPSPAGGILLETFYSEGSLVPVLSNVGVIGATGEAVDAFRPAAAAAPEKPAAAPAAATRPAPVLSPARETAAPASSAAASGGTFLSPRARRFMQNRVINLGALAGSGPGGRVLEADVRRAAESSPRISPAARDLINEGYRPVPAGSGPDGLVTARDLGRPGKKLSPLRRIIAGRLQASLQETAQYTISAAANATTLLALRGRIKAGQALPGSPEVNLNDLVMFAAVRTLRDFPDLNAEMAGDTLYQSPEIHLGFACDTPRGLLVPVVRNSQQLTLPQLSQKIKALAQQALEGKITPDDLNGGTFTITNLGSLGVESFTPVLNAPQVAILGVCAITLRPVKRDGRVEFAEHLGLSLTADHRAVDGAPAARYLQALIKNIESIDTLL
jgi:pyruvate dehydrogenase E2 component (dihydrolipoamide acetyltransferase)